MLPLLLAGIVAWTLPMPWPIAATWLAIWWGSVILVFLAGVRRGLTFKVSSAPRPIDLVIMLWLFALGAGAMAVARPLLALVLLAIGYASVAVLDPAAARAGVAPAHLARLRPPQMAIGLLGLIALLVHRVALAIPV
jgi:hypothetical protein